MAVLPELVLYYVGITSAVKVGGHFDAYVEKLKWIYIYLKEGCLTALYLKSLLSVHFADFQRFLVVSLVRQYIHRP